MNFVEAISVKAIKWIGTPESLVVHTIGFIGIFILRLFGLTLDSVMLILTTIVSLEAIYMAIFIQMSVNKQAQQLLTVTENIQTLSDDIEEVQENIEELVEEDANE